VTWQPGRVSVIIPAFNAAPYIAATLDSVLAQTHPDVEVIVVDDGSTDATAAEVQRYTPRVRYLHQANSGGCGKPRNEGMKIATGEFFVFLDSDDILAPHRLASEHAVMAAHPEVALLFTNYQDFAGTERRGAGHFQDCPILSARLAARGTDDPLLLDSATSTELLLTENFGSSSPMIRRSVVDTVGWVDETMGASEDFDFQYRVATRFPIAVIPVIGWYKRLHQASMSSNLPNILGHKILMRQRLLAAETAPRRRRKLRRTLAAFHAALAFFQTGRDNAAAWRHALASFRLQPAQDPRFVLRLILDTLGRRTNLHGGVS
jgi:glycosyltransferase involved in cell wall biosynthesis